MSKGYGAGTVFERADHRWVAMWERPPQDGKRRRGTRLADTEAAAWKRMREAQRAEGRSSSRSRGSTESVGAYLDRWLADVVARTRRERTLVGYRAIIAALVPDVLVADIADPRLGHRIQVWLNSLDRHPRTIHHYAACLRAAFGYAVRKGMMERNPAADLDLPAIPRTERIPLTAAELRAFLEHAKGDSDDKEAVVEDSVPELGTVPGPRQSSGELASLPSRPAGMEGWADAEHSTRYVDSASRVDPLYPLWVTAAWTGMRQGELLGLRWQDVDLERAQITVRSSLARLPGKRGMRYVITEPKTERSRRIVPLLPDVVDVLRTVRKSQLDRPGKLDQGLVFCTEAGSPLDAARVGRAFGEALKAAGVRPVRFHDLRHGAVSSLIERGVDLATVSALIGHSSIATTVDMYGHLTERHKAEAMARLAEAR